MAEWDRNKVSPSEINNGKQFTRDDDLTVQELNAMVNNSFYGVDFAEALADQPDISEINSSGSPEVSIIDNVKNGITYKKFKFKNLGNSIDNYATYSSDTDRSTTSKGSITILKYGRVCVLNVWDTQLKSGLGIYSDATLVTGIPVAFRPAQQCTANFSAEGNGNASLVYANTDGSVSIGSWNSQINTDKHMTFQIVYISQE